MHSCLYEGRLRHRRFTPTQNAFDYSLFMVYIDLSELEDACSSHPLWSAKGRNVATFSREDHLGNPADPLDVSVRDLVETEAGLRPDGPIRLLTHFRYFGHRFNPVSFFYCFDHNEQLTNVVAEVNNTPWGEQHPYVLSESQNTGSADHPRYAFNKAFHVSPYMPMNHRYVWQFSTPGRALSVHMDNVDQEGRCFDATMTLTRREMTHQSLSRVLYRYPAMTVQIVASIYWQAFRLWWKRTPIYDHPNTATANTRKATA